MVAVVKRLTRATVTRICEGSIPSSHPKNSTCYKCASYYYKQVFLCICTQFGTHERACFFMSALVKIKEMYCFRLRIPKNVMGAPRITTTINLGTRTTRPWKARSTALRASRRLFLKNGNLLSLSKPQFVT